jgi:hypothetical protein
MSRIKTNRRKQIIIVLIIISIGVSSYSTLIAYRYGVFRDENRGFPISVRVSNVKWRIDGNVNSDSYPDQTHVTFIIETEIWVEGATNVNYTHYNSLLFSPGFRSSFTGFTIVKREVIVFTPSIIERTYPPGSTFYSRAMPVWINRKNITELPNGLYDFWSGTKYDPANIYHTYLRKSVFGMKISTDPMPTAWGKIDWIQKDWGILD